MNEQEPLIKQTPVVPSSSTTSVTIEKIGFLKNIWAKIPLKLKEPLIKFSESKIYGNKKIFWLVTGAFALIVLTLLIGLIFGSRRVVTKSTNVKIIPTPQTETSPAPEVKDALMETDDRLKALKNRINNLDVKQSKISPPHVNFKVIF